MTNTNYHFDVTPEERAGGGHMLKRQLFRKTQRVLPSEVNLAGKTAVITGSNSGLGFECARQLLEIGVSKLILAVRSLSKGEAARKELLSTTKLVDKNAQSIEIWELDLSSYDSIFAFVERTKGLARLDIFIQNAGVSKMKFELNKTTGHEECLQVNYLSHVLITILLLPILKEKNSPEKPGRYVMVSSETSAWAAFKEREFKPLLPSFDKPENFNNADRYWTTKLLGQLFMLELIKHVSASTVVINTVSPGWCPGSNLTSDYNGTVLSIVFAIAGLLIGRPVKLGARTLTDAAVRHGAASHGHYIEDGKFQPYAPLFYKPEGKLIAEQLWNETMDELSFAGVRSIIDKLQ